MIFDKIENIKNYEGLNKIYPALKFIAETDFSGMELGKYQLNEDCYYMVQEYETAEKIKSEAHKAYADIQVILEGEEYIGVAQLEEKHQAFESKPEKDVWYYNVPFERITLTKGCFIVLYPNDLHCPGMAAKEPLHCRKLVVKVRL